MKHEEIIKRRIRQRQYYARNREKCLETVRRWRLNNLAYARAYDRRRYKKNDLRSRKAHLKRKFGLSLQQYDELLIGQNNTCAICFSSGSKDQKHKRLFVDHDHITGKIRGLLCSLCNHILGCAEDKITILENSIVYLKRNKYESC